MGLSIGILGLPNVGKSTIFNALTKTQSAQAANYPFCTIEPNKAIVSVPDERLLELAKIVNPKHIQYSQVEFVDIAGLVRGASRGEGLGNQFLANVRECECLLHIVRCFQDENITHVEGRINPVNDCEIIELELILADLQTITNKIIRLQKQTKASKDAGAQLSLALQLKEFLESGQPVRLFSNKDSDEFIGLDKELRFLSNKEIIYVANVDEDALIQGNEFVNELSEYAKKTNSVLITLCATLEIDLIDMSDIERREFLVDLGMQGSISGLGQVIKMGFEKLGLISYFTAGVKEVRAWTIKKGDTAPVAAGVIHKDFERGFVRAETISYDDFIKSGGEHRAKEAGLMISQGKDYVVRDGDVMLFRFNV